MEKPTEAGEVPDGSRKRGMSLVEVLVAISVMAVAATYYGSVVVASASHHHGYQEIETGTLLYLRQVVRLRAQDPRAANRPFDQEADFGVVGNANSCVEFPYNDQGPRDLDPPAVDNGTGVILATGAGHFEFPANSPWLLDIQNDYPALWNEGYRVTVNAARHRTNVTGPQREWRLIKYAIRVDRVDGAGGRRNIVTGQIFAEVP